MHARIFIRRRTSGEAVGTPRVGGLKLAGEGLGGRRGDLLEERDRALAGGQRRDLAEGLRLVQLLQRVLLALRGGGARGVGAHAAAVGGVDDGLDPHAEVGKVLGAEEAVDSHVAHDLRRREGGPGGFEAWWRWRVSRCQNRLLSTSS